MFLIEDLTRPVPLALDLYGAGGELIAPLRLSVPLDGLSAERLKYAAERAVPGARRSRISEEGPMGRENAILTVTGEADEVLARGLIEVLPPSPS